MGDPTVDVALLPIEEIVPSRSVLTELARGFLLTRDRDRHRAARFASTFLRERTTASPPSSPKEAAPVAASVSQARRLLGRLPHGAVERPSRVAAP